MIEHVKEVLYVGEVVNGLIVGPSHSVWMENVRQHEDKRATAA
jgi:hypothetical protein